MVDFCGFICFLIEKGEKGKQKGLALHCEICLGLSKLIQDRACRNEMASEHPFLSHYITAKHPSVAVELLWFLSLLKGTTVWLDVSKKAAVVTTEQH